MAEYTVTIRDQADIETLEKWADAEERDPTHQLNYLIRGLMQQRAKAGTATPRAMGGTRRGARDKAA